MIYKPLHRLQSDDTKLKYCALAYLIILMTLMWIPVGGLGLPNYVLGFRFDHLLHIAAYLPCAWALSILLPHHKWVWFPLTVIIGAGIEGVQFFLPYRGFDLSDMVANTVGALIGWILLLISRHRTSAV